MSNASSGLHPAEGGGRLTEWIQDKRRMLLGILAVIMFFVIWEAVFTWVVPLNKFFMSKPSLIWLGFLYDNDPDYLAAEAAAAAHSVMVARGKV